MAGISTFPESDNQIFMIILPKGLVIRMGDTNGVDLPTNHGAKFCLITVTTRLSLTCNISQYLPFGRDKFPPPYHDQSLCSLSKF